MKALRIVLVIALVLLVAVPAAAAPLNAPLQQDTEIGFLEGIFQAISNMFGWLLQQFNLFFEFVVRAIQNFINFIGDLLSGLLNLIGGLIGWVIDQARLGWERLMNLVNFFIEGGRTVWSWVQSGVRVIGDFIGILRLLFEIVIGLFRVVGAYIGESIALMVSVFTAIQDATPVTILGLPRCVSAPLESEVCALWYVFEHTLFQGTLGDVMIAIALVMIDVWILAYVVKSIFGVMRRAEGVTNVG